MLKSAEFVLPSGFIFQQDGVLIISRTVENMAQNKNIYTDITFEKTKIISLKTCPIVAGNLGIEISYGYR